MTTTADRADHWERWLVHLLWATATRTSMLGEVALAGTPLSLAGLGLLENLAARPGLTVAELSRRAPQTQQALSQISSRLEKLGYLERRLVSGGRGIGLYLTGSGEEARGSAHAAVQTFEAALADALGPRRHQRLVSLLAEAEAVVCGMASGPRAARDGSNQARR